MGCALCVNAGGNGMFWYFYHGLSGAACRSSPSQRSDKQPSQHHWMSSLPHGQICCAVMQQRSIQGSKMEKKVCIKQSTFTCELADYAFSHTILIRIHFIRHKYWFAVRKGTNESGPESSHVWGETTVVPCCVWLMFYQGLAVSRQIASSITSRGAWASMNLRLSGWVTGWRWQIIQRNWKCEIFKGHFLTQQMPGYLSISPLLSQATALLMAACLSIRTASGGI